MRKGGDTARGGIRGGSNQGLTFAGLAGIRIPLKKANPGKSGDAKLKGPDLSGQPGYQRKISED